VYRCESSTDYIRVRDGVEDDSPLITTYCTTATHYYNYYNNNYYYCYNS